VNVEKGAAMELKSAFGKMKTATNTAMHFFFCDIGADGEPALVVDPKPIGKSEIDAVMSAAKGKVKCAGTMLINTQGELRVSPKGASPSRWRRGSTRRRKTPRR
jgi:hypothetical protein